jgi:oxalate decarboxylase/phosphoglucose isomerase-like protein (cupin superfamily)
MRKATTKEQKMYEEVYHFLSKVKVGESAKWRSTSIERMQPDGIFKMNDGTSEYYHWHPHMAAIIVITLCERIQIGQVEEVS